MALSPALLDLCDELLLEVLAHLDVPDLLNASRTCHHLRYLCIDPVLHSQRLQEASVRLSLSLSHRPPLSSLHPPTSTIYLSSTQVLARHLSRSLISIKLNRSLSHRPSASSLVSSNILPEECCRHHPETGEVIWGAGIAPSIVNAKRKVERERLKDGLRAWLAGRGADILQRKSIIAENGNKEKPTVRSLVQRFAQKTSSKDIKHHRWGRGDWIEKERCAPTRAHVQGLRRFWEGIGRQGQAV